MLWTREPVSRNSMASIHNGNIITAYYCIMMEHIFDMFDYCHGRHVSCVIVRMYHCCCRRFVIQPQLPELANGHGCFTNGGLEYFKAGIRPCWPRSGEVKKFQTTKNKETSGGLCPSDPTKDRPGLRAQTIDPITEHAFWSHILSLCQIEGEINFNKLTPCHTAKSGFKKGGQFFAKAKNMR